MVLAEAALCASSHVEPLAIKDITPKNLVLLKLPSLSPFILYIQPSAVHFLPLLLNPPAALLEEDRHLCVVSETKQANGR